MVNIYIFYTISSQVIWGLLPLFWILLNQVAPLYILATRIIWSAFFCFLLILQRGLLPALKNVLAQRGQWPYIMGATIMVTINWGTFIYSMTQGYMLQSSLAYYMNPIVVILFGSLIFREHLGMLQRFAILFAATGVAISFFIYGQFPFLASIICLSWAAYSLLKKKIILDSQVSVFIESFTMIPLAAAYIIYCEGTGSGAIGILQGWQWLLLPATGIVTAAPMMLFTAGIKGAPVTVTGICMYLAPSMTLVIGLATGETLTMPLLITFIFTWIAVAMYLAGLFRIVDRLRQKNAG